MHPHYVFDTIWQRAKATAQSRKYSLDTGASLRDDGSWCVRRLPMMLPQGTTCRRRAYMAKGKIMWVVSQHTLMRATEHRSAASSKQYTERVLTDWSMPRAHQSNGTEWNGKNSCWIQRNYISIWRVCARQRSSGTTTEAGTLHSV